MSFVRQQSPQHARILKVSSRIGIFLALLLFVFALPSITHGQTSVTVEDVAISLYSNPTTDADRANYESIINSFADGVFESSNGATKLGTVRIYRNGEYANKADIVWVESCRPNATPSGRSNPAQHINMCDRFSGTDFLDSSSHVSGGYTLAHEWGHYYYGLYDEYRGNGTNDTELHMPHSTDKPVANSIMNSQWNAVGGNFDWLNFSTDLNNTGDTAQHRVYGEDAWDTLIRNPSQDPKDGQRANLWTRIHYPELADVAPGENEAPRIDLPGDPRSNLKILWVDEDVSMQIVIDHSGSMSSDSKMANAKTAAKLLVDLAEVGNATIGIIKFDDAVTVVRPLTAIDSQQVKDDLKSAIDTIQPSGNTAIGDAAKKALDDLVSHGGEDSNRVVYLLTDGLSNTGLNPTAVIPDYQAADIPLFTFAYGSGANTTVLQQLASETGGKYYFSPTTLADLTQAFQDANTLTSSTVGVSRGSVSINSVNPQSVAITVDSTLGKLLVTATYVGSPPDVDITLLDPLGNSTGSAGCSQSGIETLCLIEINDPQPGEWKLEFATTSVSKDIDYRVEGASGDSFTLAASISVMNGEVVTYPEPIVLLAILTREVPISGATVEATIQAPDGTTTAVLLTDDGVLPDALANDGLYSTILDYNQNGTHILEISFDNSGGTAASSYLSYLPSAGPDGQDLPPQQPVPITEGFERFARTQITVTGLQSDDHGNIPADATTLHINNVDLPGKIDYSGDLDVFEFTSSDDGNLVFRVSSYALGMEPYLKIFDEDGSKVLAEAELDTAAPANDYLNVTLPVTAGQKLFAEVSHAVNGAHGGTYAVSVGQRIVSDTANDIPLYVSTKKRGTADGTDFSGEDILKYTSSTGWSIFFDGSSHGLTKRHNISAFDISAEDDIYLAFSRNRARVPGLSSKVFGQDIVQFDGSDYSIFFDGSDVGLTRGSEKIDGLEVLDGSESPIAGGCKAYLLISTVGNARVQGINGSIVVHDEDVLGFCQTNLGEATTGVWHQVFDGSDNSVVRNDLKGISATEDGSKLFFTAKRNVDLVGVTGKAYDVVGYDLGSGTFFGPVFSPFEEGMTSPIDGLHYAP